MTVKWGGSHPWVVAVHPDASPPLLSSYVCKRLPKLIVILRPPKDLDVLLMYQQRPCHVNHPIIVILRPPKDLAVPPFDEAFANTG
jgi:hypothetical protein